MEPLRFLLPVREGQLGKEIIAAVQEKMRCTAKDMRDHGLGRPMKKNRRVFWGFGGATKIIGMT